MLWIQGRLGFLAVHLMSPEKGFTLKTMSVQVCSRSSWFTLKPTEYICNKHFCRQLWHTDCETSRRSSTYLIPKNESLIVQPSGSWKFRCVALWRNCSSSWLNRQIAAIIDNKPPMTKPFACTTKLPILAKRKKQLACTIRLSLWTEKNIFVRERVCSEPPGHPLTEQPLSTVIVVAPFLDCSKSTFASKACRTSDESTCSYIWAESATRRVICHLLPPQLMQW